MASSPAAVAPSHLLVPLVWGLWGVAGYYPHSLEPYMSSDAFETLLVFRCYPMFIFCGLAWLHAFEALYAASLCRAAGLAAPDTARWAASVLLAGAFALARIRTPTVNDEKGKSATSNGN